jgi:hypothetical protein
MYSAQDLPRGRGFPIRISADQRSLASPRGFSQRATSFIASWRQGIHRTPFSCSTTSTARAQDQTAPSPARLTLRRRHRLQSCLPTSHTFSDRPPNPATPPRRNANRADNPSARSDSHLKEHAQPQPKPQREARVRGTTKTKPRAQHPHRQARRSEPMTVPAKGQNPPEAAPSHLRCKNTAARYTTNATPIAPSPWRLPDSNR